MKKSLLIIVLPFIILSLYLFRNNLLPTGAPPYGVADNPPQDVKGQYSWLEDWVRPDIPTTVALQVGHYKNEDLPDELEKLRGNTGASGAGLSEWEVNLKIAELTADILREEGIEVDILPATVPPRYFADVFVAIHADGNLDPGKSGYKGSDPWRDFTGGRSGKLLEFVETEYEKSTGLVYDPNVTRNMKGYYAFGWWRYEHSVHPMTTAIILETGFLSSPSDRTIIVDQPEVSAQGIASGIIMYLESESLI